MTFKPIDSPMGLISFLENWTSFDGPGTEYDYVSLVHVFQSCLKGIQKGSFTDFEFEAFARLLSDDEKKILKRIATAAVAPLLDDNEE